MSGERPAEMQYLGYSEHDACSIYACPKCRKEYDGWQLLNIKHDSCSRFMCKCGQILKKPR